MKKPHSKIKNIVINSIISCASILITLLCIEAFLAVFHPFKITDQLISDQYDPIMGWVNKPNIIGETKLGYTVNTYFHRQHNSHGLRSLREVSYAKPPGVKRILLIGDSFFWGYGVDDDKVVSELLQKMAGDRVEVINGAVSGYGTDQELLWLMNEGLKYKPDLVICGMFPDNDLEEISTSMIYFHPKPYFTLENNKLTVHNVPVPNIEEYRGNMLSSRDNLFRELKTFLRHNVHTYQFVVSKLNSIPKLRKTFILCKLCEDFSGLYKKSYFYTLTDMQKRASLSDALVKEMARICATNSATFLLCFIPAKEQAPALSTGTKPGDSLEKNGSNANMDYHLNSENSSYLSAFTAANRIAFLDLLPIVRKNQLAGTPLYYTGSEDHHWNESGHRVAAQAIFDYLWGAQ